MPEARLQDGACEEPPRRPPGWARVGERRRGWGAEGASVPGGRQPAASLQCSVFLSCPRSFLETSQVGRAGRCLLPAALTEPRRVGSMGARVCVCVCVCERVCGRWRVCAYGNVSVPTCVRRGARVCGVSRPAQPEGQRRPARRRKALLTCPFGRDEIGTGDQ